MAAKQDLTGKTFGMYTVLFWVKAVNQWLCQCTGCEQKKLIDQRWLKNGRASCEHCTQKSKTGRYAGKSVIERLKDRGVEVVGIDRVKPYSMTNCYICKCKKCGEEIRFARRDDKSVDTFTGLCQKCLGTGMAANTDRDKRIVEAVCRAKQSMKEIGEEFGISDCRVKQVFDKLATNEHRRLRRENQERKRKK